MTGEPAGSAGRSTRGASNLQLRTVSAIVLIAIALVATWFGGLAFRLFAALIGAAVFHEWLAMTRAPGASVHRLLLWLVMGAFLLALVAGLDVRALIFGLVSAAVAGGAAGLLSRQGLWPASGIAYAGLGALSLAMLRGQDDAGLAAIIVLFAVVWTTDILAYVFGRAIGGPKLAPKISPGKTWSGAVGGAASGTAAGLAAGSLFGFAGGWVILGILALVLSVLSQLGDLFESFLKRKFAVKDSSRLIPGHGGVMDRVDGLIAAALFFWLLGVALGGLDDPARSLFAN